MPLVDDDDNPIDLSKPWCLQTENDQRRTLELLAAHREELEDEWHSTFTTTNLWTGRVLCEVSNDLPYVAYLSDSSPDARVVVDDLTFEIWEEWQEEPRPSAVKPKNLEDL